MVILSVCFAHTDIVLRWTGSSVTWTTPLIKSQLARRGRSECVHRQKAQHVDHFELVIRQSWEKYVPRYKVTNSRLLEWTTQAMFHK
jgi:hypothetical protein